jgi:hypothetical protein
MASSRAAVMRLFLFAEIGVRSSLFLADTNSGVLQGQDLTLASRFVFRKPFLGVCFPCV